MVNIRKYALTSGAVMAAAAIGFVMQTDKTAQTRYSKMQVPDITGTRAAPLEVTDITLTSAAPAASTPAPVAETALSTPEKPVAETKSAPQVPALKDEPAKLAAVQTDAPAKVDVPAETPVAAKPLTTNPCEVTMTAKPDAAAMVNVALSAPCFPNERVTMHHNGLMFTEVTDAKGQLLVDVPALTKNAIFIAAFANGDGALASVTVEGIDSFDRKVVQGKAMANLHISAYEFGADFRQEGHVNVQSGRSQADAVSGTGGFIHALGDREVAEALVAEIYTFPTAEAKEQGDIRITVETEITTANCGLRVDAQTLEISKGQRMKVKDLTLPIPGCDAVGDFLVLQNLLEDLKVARK